MTRRLEITEGCDQNGNIALPADGMQLAKAESKSSGKPQAFHRFATALALVAALAAFFDSSLPLHCGG